MKRSLFGAGGLVAVVAASLALAVCGPPEAKVVREGDRTIIEDRTGKRWDVTTAVEHYGFKAGSFQYGLGPNAIRPIDDPRMLYEGDTYYPDDDAEITVLGVSIDGDSRAYPISVLRHHEVANEVFGDTHVAVAY